MAKPRSAPERNTAARKGGPGPPARARMARFMACSTAQATMASALPRVEMMALSGLKSHSALPKAATSRRRPSAAWHAKMQCPTPRSATLKSSFPHAGCSVRFGSSMTASSGV